MGAIPRSGSAQPRVEQGDVFKFYPHSRSVIPAHLWYKKDLKHRRSRNFLARLVARFFPRYIPFAEHFKPCSPIAYRQSSLLICRLFSPHPPSSENTNLHIVGKFLGLLAPSTSSLLDDRQRLVACCNLWTDPSRCFCQSTPRLHCRRDVHRRHPHPGALRGAILSAKSPASTFHFRRSPTMSLRSDFEF